MSDVEDTSGANASISSWACLERCFALFLVNPDLWNISLLSRNFSYFLKNMNLNKEVKQLVSTQSYKKGLHFPCVWMSLYNAAISDCAKLQRWPLALQHLEALQQRWGEDGRWCNLMRKYFSDVPNGWVQPPTRRWLLGGGFNFFRFIPTWVSVPPPQFTGTSHMIRGIDQRPSTRRKLSACETWEIAKKPGTWTYLEPKF